MGSGWNDKTQSLRFAREGASRALTAENSSLTSQHHLVLLKIPVKRHWNISKWDAVVTSLYSKVSVVSQDSKAHTGEQTPYKNIIWKTCHTENILGSPLWRVRKAHWQSSLHLKVRYNFLIGLHKEIHWINTVTHVRITSSYITVRHFMWD